MVAIAKTDRLTEWFLSDGTAGRMRRAWRIALFVGLLTLAGRAPLNGIEFRVRLDPPVAGAPVQGRLLVFLSQRGFGEPRFGPSWYQPEPFFGRDVASFAPGDPQIIDDRADGFPQSLANLPPGTYRAQAVLARSFDSPFPGRGEGNLYGAAVPMDANSETVDLVLDRVVPPEEAPLAEGTVEVRLRSRLLSEFHRRDVVEPATVILPPGYEEEPERRYPTIYIIGGFGADHRSLIWQFITGPRQPAEGEEPLIRVMLSGQSAWGHHAYANSATNGPRGDALVKEMIPQIDRQFRTVADSAARFVTGHSSGGWASLWLQVTYPDVFGGVWSYAPDPVDFRDFQRIDIYADPPGNMYRDEQGNRRPLARRGGRPVIWYDSFCRMDDVLGRGGQLRSFEAVFSPLGLDGLPQRLWDRASGTIDPQVARAWRQYDIRLRLEENWEELGPKLKGKLHVIAGGEDTFYLEGAVSLLAESLTRLRSDAEVVILPGVDHSGVLHRAQIEKMRRQISEAFRTRHTPP